MVRSAFNYSLLITNCSFPQGYVNPPIRGSIEKSISKEFNVELFCINPPIRGSIAKLNKLDVNDDEYDKLVSIPL